MNCYKLTTIKDIFDKVPADRIETCCKELGAGLAQTAAMRDFAIELGKANGIDPNGEMPDEFTWIDDGKGDIVTELHAHEIEGQLGEVRTKL